MKKFPLELNVPPFSSMSEPTESAEVLGEDVAEEEENEIESIEAKVDEMKSGDCKWTVFFGVALLLLLLFGFIRQELKNARIRDS
jgi:hypothetical protein